MIYTNYSEKIFGNKTKIALLRTFYKIPEKVWSMRDLARFVGTYHTTVLDNLGDLEEMGIIQIGGHGKAKTIKLNRDGYIFQKIIRPLFEAEKKTFEELLSDIKNIFNCRGIKLLALFGSIAEHKERPNSDIDILIVSDRKEKIEEIIEEKQGFISAKFGNELSPHILTTREFKSKQNAPFLVDAKKNKIILFGEWK